MIKIYDRKLGTYFEEKVVGENLLHMIYDYAIGRSLLFFIKRKFISSLYGKAMDSKSSKRMIEGFIRDNGLNMKESVKSQEEFETFNDFFTRKLNPEARPFISEENVFISPCDSRLLAFENINPQKIIQVKGLTYSLDELLGHNHWNTTYEGGTALIFRLSPLDYHRFHFIDSGTADETRTISGHYQSVNPIALAKIPRIYVENKRSITSFHSDHFGEILYVEVGATNVGTIIQTFQPGIQLNKGDEKGFFKFGGSTVILFVEKGRLNIDSDILIQSEQGIESRVLFGETIGIR
ncbi:MAG: phosphatidylserine decarboxylase [Clostridiaceae bacterium]